MPPAACRGNPTSRSAIVADTAAGYHLLKIDGYSLTKVTPTGSCLSSSPFTVGGHRWRILYYPNGETANSADYMSVYIKLDEDHLKVQAKFQICFADHVKTQPSLKFKIVRAFTREGFTSWGYAKFFKREDFEKSNDLKEDDSFTLRCDIVVIREIRAEDSSEIVLPAETFVSVPPSDMGRQFGELLENEKGADVVFEVGGQTFAAHRCVLAARSPVFSAGLYGLMKEGDNAAGVVRIQDMEANVFKMLLRFVYTDTLPEMEEEDVMCQHLLVSADCYNLERLKLICEEKLCGYVSVGTVSNILALADRHHCNGLKKKCFNFLGDPANLSAVVAGDGFKDLSRSCPSLMEELIAMLALPPSHPK
uniref:BTB domain-containing protein n=1 Tax=Leersia perrieri TaxID=77586 RepID=A0A0D9W417_9ORYZ